MADSGTFAQVMARLEPKLRSCARETGIAEAPITVQVRYKGDTLVGVRVHSLSKGHPFSACVEPAIRKANPPPGGSPVEDFTFLSGRSPTMK